MGTRATKRANRTGGAGSVPASDNGRAVFLTGASSGIGRALAVELARRGYRLAISARREERLITLKEEIASFAPDLQVVARRLDVTDTGAVFEAFAAAAAELGGIDIAIANAGVASRSEAGSGEFEHAKRTIEVNVIGAMATVDAAVRHFRERGRGHVVGICSVAGMRGLPRSAPYSASKAALAVYLEAVRAELLGSGIDVSVIHPGFIATEINEDLPRRPFVIGAARGARIIANQIERRVRVTTAPVIPWGVLSRVLKLLPVRLLARLR